MCRIYLCQSPRLPRSGWHRGRAVVPPGAAEPG